MKKLLIAIALLGAFNVQAKTYEFNCDFDTYSTALGMGEEYFNLKFVILDDGTAVMAGNAGMAPVEKNYSQHGINFIETTDSGNKMLTTLSKPYVDTEGSAPTIHAVHSRNSMSPDGRLIASQYYGTCSFH